MGLNKLVKIFFPLFQSQLVGAAIKMFDDPPHRACAGLSFVIKPSDGWASANGRHNWSNDPRQHAGQVESRGS